VQTVVQKMATVVLAVLATMSQHLLAAQQPSRLAVVAVVVFWVVLVVHLSVVLVVLAQTTALPRLLTPLAVEVEVVVQQALTKRLLAQAVTAVQESSTFVVESQDLL